MSKPIYPDYIGNYKGKLPIKKHTKVRRPESPYGIAIWGNGHSSYTIHNTKPITDISKGLENPLWCEHIFPSDWKMYYNKDNTTYYAPTPKPSLLTKLKNRFKK